MSQRRRDWLDINYDGLNLSEAMEDFLFNTETVRSQEAFKAGDGSQLLWFVNFCLILNRPVPDWARQAFRAAYNRGLRFEIKSWDEVFGRPLKKGKQLATERRKMELATHVTALVFELHQLRGKPIGKALFESIGKKLGIGGTTASDLYYGRRKEILGQ
jgi:hypothetical protein